MSYPTPSRPWPVQRVGGATRPCAAEEHLREAVAVQVRPEAQAVVTVAAAAAHAADGPDGPENLAGPGRTAPDGKDMIHPGRAVLVPLEDDVRTAVAVDVRRRGDGLQAAVAAEGPE